MSRARVKRRCDLVHHVWGCTDVRVLVAFVLLGKLMRTDLYEDRVEHSERSRRESIRVPDQIVAEVGAKRESGAHCHGHQTCVLVLRTEAE